MGADAMQLYRGMDIGTAKLPPDQRRGIPHHLIDVLEVSEESTVAWYQPLARAAIEGIWARDGVPILVGGSGLYVSSVVYDFRFPRRDPAVRARLESEAERVGASGMHQRLAALDPAAAQRIDPRNLRRVVRALEVAASSDHGHLGALPAQPTLWRPALVVRLTAERALLTARLDARVERMWRDGIVAEVAGLLPRGFDAGTTASHAIGYAQARAQLAGTIDESAAIAQTAALTRRYARRQVSWFRRYPASIRLETDGGAGGSGQFAEALLGKLAG